MKEMAIVPLSFVQHLISSNTAPAQVPSLSRNELNKQMNRLYPEDLGKPLKNENITTMVPIATSPTHKQEIQVPQPAHVMDSTLTEIIEPQNHTDSTELVPFESAKSSEFGPVRISTPHAHRQPQVPDVTDTDYSLLRQETHDRSRPVERTVGKSRKIDQIFKKIKANNGIKDGELFDVRNRIIKGVDFEQIKSFMMNGGRQPKGGAAIAQWIFKLKLKHNNLHPSFIELIPKWQTYP